MYIDFQSNKKIAINFPAIMMLFIFGLINKSVHRVWKIWCDYLTFVVKIVHACRYLFVGDVVKRFIGVRIVQQSLVCVFSLSYSRVSQTLATAGLVELICCVCRLPLWNKIYEFCRMHSFRWHKICNLNLKFCFHQYVRILNR